MKSVPNILSVMMLRFAIVLVFVLLAKVPGLAFTISSSHHRSTIQSHRNSIHPSKSICVFGTLSVKHTDKCSWKRRTYALQNSISNDEEDEVTSMNSVENGVSGGFDQDGFANYLAPYAAAFLLTIGVTAAFIQFLLNSY